MKDPDPDLLEINIGIDQGIEEVEEIEVDQGIEKEDDNFIFYFFYILYHFFLSLFFYIFLYFIF